MSEGKDIDIRFAVIKGDIDFTNTKFFQLRSLDEAEKDLNEDDSIESCSICLRFSAILFISRDLLHDCNSCLDFLAVWLHPTRFAEASAHLACP